jgi:hypothetical protein
MNKKPRTEEQKKKISESIKKLYQNSEFREKIREATRRAMSRPEVREKLSNPRPGLRGEKNPMKRPEIRKKLSEKLRGRMLSEEVKKKISETVKKLWQNPEYRKKNKTSRGKRFGKEFRKMRSKMWKEGQNPNWKGGITPENEKIRKSLEYIIWRNEVYKRDNWTCRLCGKKCSNKDIVAHHLKLFSEFPELRFSVDNGITLCRSCHLRLHKRILNIEI